MDKIVYQLIFLGLILAFPVISQAKDDRPNIIVILADDMGFSDIGCYGGDVETPNLDKLASEGVRFSQYYNAARCCPTRASLLTGLYPHQAGIGFMTGKLGNTPSYQGHIKEEVKTIGNYFKEIGYTTIQVGKWHVGNEKNNTMPCDKGFEMAWSPMGQINYWKTQECYENGTIRKLNEDEKIYLTDVEGDKAIEYIEKANQREAPFMMYLAFNAAHWPLHAKQADIDKYRGKFRNGWDELKKERIEKLDSIGLISFKSPELITDDAVPDWNTIEPNDNYPGYHAVISGQHDQDDWDLKMAVYAAQIDCMDQNIGRIINKLKELGKYENTIIMFLQDNGGCGEGVGKQDTNAPGGPDSFLAYGLPWANLSNTPFRMYKHFVHEGGISTPFIFHWPKGMKEERKGAIIHYSFGYLIDIIPTCLDATSNYNSKAYRSLEGNSLLPVIQDDEDNSDRAIFWEHEGNRAIRKGDWKLVSRYSDDYRFFNAWGWSKEPRTKDWELYNILDDRWELNDLSEEKPELVKALKKEYQAWCKKVGVVPRKEIIKGSKFKF